MIDPPFVDVCATKDLLCDRALRAVPRTNRLYISGTYKMYACDLYRPGIMVLKKKALQSQVEI